MPPTPDSSYWGNPPHTPTAASRARQTAHPQQQPWPTPAQDAGEAFNQPAARTKPRRRSVAFVSVVVVAAVVVIICLVLFLRGAVQSGIEQITGSSADAPAGIVEDDGTFDSTAEPDTVMMNRVVRSYYGLSGSDPLTRNELDTIQHDYFHDAEHEGGLMPAGVYVVGETINAGTYWFEGEDDEPSSFYLLQPTDDGQAYNVTLLNDYYGHNLMDLKAGEVLILDNNADMQHIDPIAPLDDEFEAPYSSGVYRVGVDVPAGSYRLDVGSGADDFSAVYVMADLEYGDGSYLYEAQYVEGDTPEEIVLEEGTYVELYNMTMSPIVA